jgi:hypothetical protein
MKIAVAPALCLAALLSFGCAAEEPAPPTGTAVDPAEAAGEPSGPDNQAVDPGSAGNGGASSTPAAGASDDEAAVRAWTLGPRGAGPLRFGMTVDEARAAVPGGLEQLGPEQGSCIYVVPVGAPEGLAFMVVDGVVRRADIGEGYDVPTTLGVTPGDTEAQARAALGDQVEATPHKYVEGLYLTARSGEGETWWVVSTSAGTVTEIRAGLMPQVRWVEGCS